MRATVALLTLALLTGCSGQDRVEPTTADGPAPEESAAPAATTDGLDEETTRQIREILQRAGALFQQTRFDEALEAAASAIDLAPSHEPTYEVLSRWYGQLDRNDLAIAGFERFAAADPSGSRCMARHQALSGDRALALQTLDRCVEDAPAHGGCRSERASLRLPAGDFSGAVEDLRVAHAAAPDSRTTARYAEALRVTGSYDEARPVVEAALADDPSSVELLLALAVLQTRNREDDAAETSLRQALELDPKSHRVMRLLGGLALRRGSETEGRFLLSRADLYRDYQSTMRSLINQIAATRAPQAALMIAELELTVGEYAQAQQWVDRARAGGPSDRLTAAQAWISYAVGDVARGDAELARLGNRNDGHTALIRAVRAFRLGEHDEAARLLQQAVAHGPNERSFLRRVADLYVAMGDQGSAEAILLRAATAGYP